MIIIVCTDDPKLEVIAKGSSESNPEVYGKYYKVFGTIPKLGKHENLFIIAHGAYKGDDRNPVIGDKRQAFYVNAVELYLNIKRIFPVEYDGNVYVDACESADHDEETFSFIEALLTQIQVDHSDTDVYGRNGTASGLIPLPNARGWVKADLLGAKSATTSYN
ncbi:MAG TPA: hypothetical protein VEF04_21320 [Blastocatellia bacterium]|nr:hypothetical protein [Blastocatellia bacterium]